MLLGSHPLKPLRDILTPKCGGTYSSERIANLAERDVVLDAFDEEMHEILNSVKHPSPS